MQLSNIGVMNFKYDKFKKRNIYYKKYAQCV